MNRDECTSIVHGRFAKHETIKAIGLPQFSNQFPVIMRSTTIRLSIFFVSSFWAFFGTGISAAEKLTPELKQAWHLLRGSRQEQNLALTQAMAALKKDDKSGEWHEVMAMCCGSSDPKCGLAEIRKAILVKRNNSSILTTGALMSLRASLRPQVVQLASKAIELDPKNGRAYAILGGCAYQQSNAPHAQSYFAKAIQLSPSDFDVNELAMVFYDSNLQRKEAGECAKRLMANFPTSAKAHHLWGKWLIEGSEWEAGAKEFELAVKLDPQDTYGYNKLSKSLAQLGKFKEAAAACSTLISLEPLRQYYFLRAGFYEHAGQSQKALDDYNKVITFAKAQGHEISQGGDQPVRLRELKQCYLKRMELYEKLGHSDLALAEANEIIEKDRRPDAALEFRERLYRKQGRYDEALNDLNRLIELDNDVADWYKSRAEVYAKLKKTDLSATDLSKAKHIEAFGK